MDVKKTTRVMTRAQSRSQLTSKVSTSNLGPSADAIVEDAYKSTTDKPSERVLRPRPQALPQVAKRARPVRVQLARPVSSQIATRSRPFLRRGTTRESGTSLEDPSEYYSTEESASAESTPRQIRNVATRAKSFINRVPRRSCSSTSHQKNVILNEDTCSTTRRDTRASSEQVAKRARPLTRTGGKNSRVMTRTSTDVQRMSKINKVGPDIAEQIMLRTIGGSAIKTSERNLQSRQVAKRAQPRRAQLSRRARPLRPQVPSRTQPFVRRGITRKSILSTPNDPSEYYSTEESSTSNASSTPGLNTNVARRARSFIKRVPRRTSLGTPVNLVINRDTRVSATPSQLVKRAGPPHQQVTIRKSEKKDMTKTRSASRISRSNIKKSLKFHDVVVESQNLAQARTSLTREPCQDNARRAQLRRAQLSRRARPLCPKVPSRTQPFVRRGITRKSILSTPNDPSEYYSTEESSTSNASSTPAQNANVARRARSFIKRVPRRTSLGTTVNPIITRNTRVSATPSQLTRRAGPLHQQVTIRKSEKNMRRLSTISRGNVKKSLKFTDTKGEGQNVAEAQPGRAQLSRRARPLRPQVPSRTQPFVRRGITRTSCLDTPTQPSEYYSSENSCEDSNETSNEDSNENSNASVSTATPGQVRNIATRARAFIKRVPSRSCFVTPNRKIPNADATTVKRRGTRMTSSQIQLVKRIRQVATRGVPLTRRGAARLKTPTVRVINTPSRMHTSKRVIRRCARRILSTSPTETPATTPCPSLSDASNESASLSPPQLSFSTHESTDSMNSLDNVRHLIVDALLDNEASVAEYSFASTSQIQLRRSKRF